MARGIPGFGEDAEAGFALTAGSVLGLRWFWLATPSFYRESPVEVPGYAPPWGGNPPRLTGATGSYEYQDGVIEAVCNDASYAYASGSVLPFPGGGGGGSGPSSSSYSAGGTAVAGSMGGGGAGGGVSGAAVLKAAHGMMQPSHEVPHPACGCGFWAYWTPDAAGKHPVGASNLPVLGVVEATGRVIHGELGFRAQKCQIIALHTPVKVEARLAPIPKPPAADGLRRERDRVWDELQYLTDGARNPGSNPRYPRFLQLLGRLEKLDAAIAEAEKPDAEREKRYALAAADWSLAWQAAIEHALTVHYPQARVYSNPEAMLRAHKPGKGYLSE